MDASACTVGNLYVPAAGASSHIRCAWDVVADPSTHLKFAGDNCPLVSNVGQANWDLTNTANGDYMGDACDADVDNDNYNDAAELLHKWDAAKHECGTALADGGAGATVSYTATTLIDTSKSWSVGWWNGVVVTSGANTATVASDTATTLTLAGAGWTPATPGAGAAYTLAAPLPDVPGLSAPNRDSDGDGYLDGVECEFGSNPNDATSTPPIPAADQDGDTLGTQFETYVHTVAVNNSQTGASVDVDSDGWLGTADGDSDGDGVGDGVEVKKFNTNPMNPDSNGNGIPDATEVGCWGPLAIGAGPSLTGVDGTSPSAAPMDCDTDGDDDSYPDAAERTGAGFVGPAGAVCAGVVTNVNTDISIADGNGTSWDTDNDRVPDGIECLAGTNPLVGSALDRTACNNYVQAAPPAGLGLNPTADADGDGLLNGWEVCMWRSNPNVVDTDGDGTGDCKEAMDVNGNKQANATDATFVKQAFYSIITRTSAWTPTATGSLTSPTRR